MCLSIISTLSPILIETSNLLNEGSTDTSSKRISFGNRAIRRVLRVRRWNWARLSHTLTVVDDTQEYDLSSEISDYNPNWGIYEVYMDDEKMTPIDYNQKENTTSDHFYLKPDGKTIGFTNDIDGDEDIEIWHYPRWVNVSADDTTFNLSIPEDMLGAICLLMKAMVHGAKRQRYDERNALVDYKEEIEELVLQDASNKIKDLPQNVPTIFTYNKFNRTYSY